MTSSHACIGSCHLEPNRGCSFLMVGCFLLQSRCAYKIVNNCTPFNQGFRLKNIHSFSYFPGITKLLSYFHWIPTNQTEISWYLTPLMLYRLQQKLQDAYTVFVLVHIHSHIKQLFYHPGILSPCLLRYSLQQHYCMVFVKVVHTLSELVSHSGHVDVHYLFYLAPCCAMATCLQEHCKF